MFLVRSVCLSVCLSVRQITRKLVNSKLSQLLICENCHFPNIANKARVH